MASLEAGTDPAVINPRVAELRAEREAVTHQLANLNTPDQLGASEIQTLLTELGGLASVLGEATPPELAINPLLHIAARTSPRRLHPDASWPWTLDLLHAIDRLKTRLQPPSPSVPIRPAIHPGL